MKQFLGLSIAFALLAGCGADGEPVRPVASANVGVSSSGVSTSGTVGVVKGPVSIGISL